MYGTGADQSAGQRDPVSYTHLFSLNYIGFNTGEQNEWTIAKIYDNGVAQSIGMQMVYTLSANDTISVALNLPEGQVLSKVELREKDGQGDVIQNVEINEEQDGFSFVMPRSAVKVTKLNFVDVYKRQAGIG